MGLRICFHFVDHRTVRDFYWPYGGQKVLNMTEKSCCLLGPDMVGRGLIWLVGAWYGGCNMVGNVPALYARTCHRLGSLHVTCLFCKLCNFSLELVLKLTCWTWNLNVFNRLVINIGHGEVTARRWTAYRSLTFVYSFVPKLHLKA